MTYDEALSSLIQAQAEHPEFDLDDYEVQQMIALEAQDYARWLRQHREFDL